RYSRASAGRKRFTCARARASSTRSACGPSAPVRARRAPSPWRSPCWAVSSKRSSAIASVGPASSRHASRCSSAFSQSSRRRAGRGVPRALAQGAVQPAQALLPVAGPQQQFAELAVQGRVERPLQQLPGGDLVEALLVRLPPLELPLLGLGLAPLVVAVQAQD